MDIYSSILACLFDCRLVQMWPELKDLLIKTSNKKPRTWQLPILACKAVGGNLDQSISAAASIACLQLSIILIDDMLDDDPRGLHNVIGLPGSANLALALFNVSLDLISQSHADDRIQFLTICKLNRMMATTALGQYLDVRGPANEDDYWRIVRMKSSPFFGTALYVGAMMGGADLEVALQIERFGDLYGEMIQIHDDLNDSMATPANSDWTSGRAPLPVLYAQIVDHADKDRFLELRQSILNPHALTEAQTILIRCGAVSYCIDQLFHRYHVAKKTLEKISLRSQAELNGLLETILKPVGDLFAATGLSNFDVSLTLSEKD